MMWNDFNVNIQCAGFCSEQGNAWLQYCYSRIPFEPETMMNTTYAYFTFFFLTKSAQLISIVTIFFLYVPIHWEEYFFSRVLLLKSTHMALQIKVRVSLITELRVIVIRRDFKSEIWRWNVITALQRPRSQNWQSWRGSTTMYAIAIDVIGTKLINYRIRTTLICCYGQVVTSTFTTPGKNCELALQT